MQSPSHDARRQLVRFQRNVTEAVQEFAASSSASRERIASSLSTLATTERLIAAVETRAEQDALGPREAAE